MAKFDTRIDSAGLTTLAGLGLLAFMDKKGKDKAKAKEDKAAEALKEAAKPEEKKVEPVEPVKPAPQPQDKSGFRGKAAGAKPAPAQSKPYPLNTVPNENRPSRPFPTDQAAQTKAALADTPPAPAKKAAPAPAKTTAPAPAPQGRNRAGQVVKSGPPQGRMDFYADKRRKEELRNSSLASQMDSAKDMKKGGSVRSTASKRGDGIAKRGFTKA